MREREREWERERERELYVLNPLSYCIQFSLTGIYVINFLKKKNQFMIDSEVIRCVVFSWSDATGTTTNFFQLFINL